VRGDAFARRRMGFHCGAEVVELSSGQELMGRSGAGGPELMDTRSRLTVSPCAKEAQRRRGVEDETIEEDRLGETKLQLLAPAPISFAGG
jgi:hypothetical protein